MKKILLVTCFIALSSLQSGFSQAWQWAYTQNTTPRSQAVAVKEDHSGNFYTASFTDSVTTRIYTTIEKRDANQQPLWQKQILGDVTITDIQITAFNHAVLVGYFKGNIAIDGSNLTSVSPSESSGFIFETDETGFVLWVRYLNPVNGDFKTKTFCIGNDGNFYLTSQVSGSYGNCAFHKLDMWGFIIKNEFNNNFENRTFSHVLVDSLGNVYLSGTCGNFATFDTINANPNFSYQNFIVKYDSAFNAQWLLTRNYITFDDNNGLGTDGQNLYWAFDDFDLNADTVRIVKCDYNGQILSSAAGQLGLAFFPSIAFEVDRFGNSVLIMNTFTRFYMYRYDTALNIIWTDTIYTQSSGFPLNAGLSCYDSSFYLTSYYMNDTLIFNNMMLLNPNVGANYPSDVFVAKWSAQVPTAVNNIEAKNNSLLIFPNPAHEGFTVYSLQFTVGDVIKILDALGNVIYGENMITSNLIFRTSNFNNGIYFLKIINANNEVKGFSKLLVMH